MQILVAEDEFVRAFSVFINANNTTVQQAVAVGFNIGYNTRPVVLNDGGRPSGFGESFQDALIVNDDQTHHFAAFLEFGFAAGTLPASLAAVAHDVIEYNQGDINLGLPKRSAITQRSSRDWIESTRRESNSVGRCPQMSCFRKDSLSSLFQGLKNCHVPKEFGSSKILDFRFASRRKPKLLPLARP